jgi:Big-like domain-containing protein
MKSLLVSAALLGIAGAAAADPSRLFDPSAGGSIVSPHRPSAMLRAPAEPGLSINEDATPAPLVSPTRPVDMMVWEPREPSSFAVPAVNSNTIFLNFCPGGCLVKQGTTDSRTDTSSVPRVGQGTLSPFSQSSTVQAAVVSCVKEIFGPFGVNITTTDPGTAPHFEIMIAGQPGQILGAGFDNVGGISPFDCSTFIPNSLVFVFDVWGANVNEICATAGQEVAHSWALDHATEPSDPMTYYNYSGRRHFMNAQVQCGSDCSGGKTALGDTCTGPTLQNHACTCSGSQTQNSFQTIGGLFGTGTPTPPTINLVRPKTGDVVTGGFPIQFDMTDDQGAGYVEIRFDNTLVKTLPGAPYAANGPATIKDGTHVLKITGYDIFGASTEVTANVITGKPCSAAADCPTPSTDICLEGRCAAGPGAPNGLGQSCTTGANCASGVCSSDTSGAHHCVESCTIGKGSCPDGFGCLDTGGGTIGVCWPGYDDGTGGCLSAGGPVGMGSGLAIALLLQRRRRRA